jgi:hypothetical protein
VRFPHYFLAEDTQKQRSWWWQYGYRLKKTDAQHTSFLWVCGICVAKPRPPQHSKYTYVASTSRSTEAHLMAVHHISKTPAQRTASRRYGGQKTIHEAIGVSTGDSQQQTLFGKLQPLLNAKDNHLLLMDWIFMDNLPFWVVESNGSVGL